MGGMAVSVQGEGRLQQLQRRGGQGPSSHQAGMRCWILCSACHRWEGERGGGRGQAYDAPAARVSPGKVPHTSHITRALSLLLSFCTLRTPPWLPPPAPAPCLASLPACHLPCHQGPSLPDLAYMERLLQQHWGAPNFNALDLGGPSLLAAAAADPPLAEALAGLEDDTAVPQGSDPLAWLSPSFRSHLHHSVHSNFSHPHHTTPSPQHQVPRGLIPRQGGREGGAGSHLLGAGSVMALGTRAEGATGWAGRGPGLEEVVAFTTQLVSSLMGSQAAGREGGQGQGGGGEGRSHGAHEGDRAAAGGWAGALASADWLRSAVAPAVCRQYGVQRVPQLQCGSLTRLLLLALRCASPPPAPSTTEASGRQHRTPVQTLESADHDTLAVTSMSPLSRRSCGVGLAREGEGLGVMGGLVGGGGRAWGSVTWALALVAGCDPGSESHNRPGVTQANPRAGLSPPSHEAGRGGGEGSGWEGFAKEDRPSGNQGGGRQSGFVQCGAGGWGEPQLHALAVEAVAAAPPLADLHHWCQWPEVFQPCLGRLEDWLGRMAGEAWVGGWVVGGLGGWGLAPGWVAAGWGRVHCFSPRHLLKQDVGGGPWRVLLPCALAPGYLCAARAVLLLRRCPECRVPRVPLPCAAATGFDKVRQGLRCY
ncbi:hypothetical protein V8C86DRAFT_194753 [Haematococcus lacustris]